MGEQFTHVDPAGNARMVDVSGKDVTHRTAVAEGFITMSPQCFAMVKEGRAKKGDVLGVAQVAGIMATKRTADLIPLCHVLALTKSQVEFTGVSVALLTVYDMCKAVDKRMVLSEIRLLEKHGGKSGDLCFEEAR